MTIILTKDYLLLFFAMRDGVLAMSFKVTNNLGVAGVKAMQRPKSANTQDENTVRAQNFDSAIFAAKPTGQEAFVHDTVADVVQQAHVRPTKGELNALRGEIEKGNYQIDIQKLASSILLLAQEE